MSEKALVHQKKIMEDIEKDLAEKKEKLNKFDAEYKSKQKPSKKDDFFLSGSEAEGDEIEDEQ